MNVHIIGGGIGGLSCALHLARLRARGFTPPDLGLHVYERAARLGGKAGSQFENGRWPGEHGFRFFPNFYRCIVDTLRHIPIDDAHRERRGLGPSVGPSVFHALHAAGEGGIGVNGRIVHIERAPSLTRLPITVARLLEQFTVTPRDITVFTTELTRFLCTCHDRALRTWEQRTLSDFIAEHDFSPAMLGFLRSLRALSAMRAERGSLRTLLFTAVQLLADFDPEFHLWDALLPGPTDDLMLEPWEAELRRLGVVFHFEHELQDLAFAPSEFGVPGRLERARLRHPAGELALDGADDLVVLAVPFERARPLLLAAPNLPAPLEGVRRIEQRADNLGDGAEPMVGVQFWLRVDRPMAKGHVVYPASPWALTSVSQAQFWRATFARPLADTFGAVGLEGVLSAIVSAWDIKAPRLGKAPKDCTPEEIARETFAQILEHSGVDLGWDDVLDWHVDADIEFGPTNARCTTPLWVSPAGSYLDRPLPDPGLGNFFVASDWARTETDVGSMESADEAARWVVRAIGRQLPEPPPEAALPVVRPIRLWAPVEAARAVDQWMFDRGMDPTLDLSGPARRGLLGTLRAVGKGGEVASRAGSWASRLVDAVTPDLGLVGRVVGLLERVEGASWKEGDEDSDLEGLLRGLEEVD